MWNSLFEQHSPRYIITCSPHYVQLHYLGVFPLRQISAMWQATSSHRCGNEQICWKNGRWPMEIVVIMQLAIKLLNKVIKLKQQYDTFLLMVYVKASNVQLSFFFFVSLAARGESGNRFIVWLINTMWHPQIRLYNSIVYVSAHPMVIFLWILIWQLEQAATLLSLDLAWIFIVSSSFIKCLIS